MDDMENEGSTMTCPHCGGKIVCSKDVTDEDRLEEARSDVRDKMQKYMSEDEE